MEYYQIRIQVSGFHHVSTFALNLFEEFEIIYSETEVHILQSGIISDFI